MSSEYTPTRGRRSSSRRGDRRSGRPNSGGSSSSNSSSRPRQEPKQPQKKTLWQKIAAFFGVKPAQKSSASQGGYGTVTPAQSPSSSSAERPERSRPQKQERPVGFRKPEQVEVTTSRIYVGNLSFDASESDLSELFSGVGSVQNVEIVANKYTQKSKGFAFVQMASVDEAKRAVADLHDKDYMGRKLVVSGAKAVEEKRSERSRQPEQATTPEEQEQPASEPATAQQQPEQ